MKVCCISDLHGHLPTIDNCDLLLIAGDICPATDHTIMGQMVWLDLEFRQWLKSLPAKNVVGIAGNHDFIFQRKPHLVPKELKWHYLNCTSIVVDGVKIYGSPWQNWFYDWAFNAPQEGGEKFLADIYAKIPDDTNIVISHGPPLGYGDLVPSNVKSYNAGTHVGSKSLTAYIKEKHPQLVVTGHIHSSHGIYKLGDTTVCNASLLDEAYNVFYKSRYFELSEKTVTPL